MTQRRRGTTPIEVAALSGIIGLLATITIPSIFEAREASRRTQCKDLMHQQSLAMHNYHDVFDMFPPAWVQHSWEADEPDAWGWGAFLLPFADEAPRYNSFDFNLPPSGQAANSRDALMTPVWIYQCPAHPDQEDGTISNYAVNYGSLPPPRWEPGTLGGHWPGAIATLEMTDGIAWCNSNCGFRDITDGSSTTIMIGERSAFSSNARWVGVRGNLFEYDAVSDLSRHSPINGGPGSFSSMHAGRAHFVLCDGAVRFISEDVNDASAGENDPPIIERLATRNGREVIGAF